MVVPRRIKGCSIIDCPSILWWNSFSTDLYLFPALTLVVYGYLKMHRAFHRPCISSDGSFPSALFRVHDLGLGISALNFLFSLGFGTVHVLLPRSPYTSIFLNSNENIDLKYLRRVVLAWNQNIFSLSHTLESHPWGWLWKLSTSQAA